MGKTSAKTLAIIPARGGSKGISRKNIKEFAGRPLIAWTIEPARASGVFDRIIVATEDEEISDIAQQHGVEMPLLLPGELTQDDSSILTVIKYVLEQLEKKKGEKYENVVLLEPTFPIRTTVHIKESLDLFNSKDVDSVVSVVPVDGHFNPHWQFTVKDDHTLSVFTGENMSDIIPRRQQLPVTYTRNGAIYIFKASLLFQDPISIYGNKTIAYIMGKEFAVDIDEPKDWDLAEKKISELDS